MATTKLSQVSPVVRYTDSNGFEKTAIITGTRKTIKEGTEVPRPDKGSANLWIISPLDPKARSYSRNNIPLGEGPRTFRLVTADEDVAADLVGTF